MAGVPRLGCRRDRTRGSVRSPDMLCATRLAARMFAESAESVESTAAAATIQYPAVPAN